MAMVCRPKRSEEEVSVLQARLPIEAMGEISDPERGWISDPLGPFFARSWPGISQPNNGRMERMMALPASVCSIHEAPGFRFLCCCPRVVPFGTNGIPNGRLER